MGGPPRPGISRLKVSSSSTLMRLYTRSVFHSSAQTFGERTVRRACAQRGDRHELPCCGKMSFMNSSVALAVNRDL
jgi:hypothetical protein